MGTLKATLFGSESPPGSIFMTCPRRVHPQKPDRTSDISSLLAEYRIQDNNTRNTNSACQARVYMLDTCHQQKDASCTEGRRGEAPTLPSWTPHLSRSISKSGPCYMITLLKNFVKPSLLSARERKKRADAITSLGRKTIPCRGLKK